MGYDLATHILSNTQKRSLDILDSRDLGDNGVSNMSTKNGVQGITVHVNTKAVYAFYNAHGLNNVRSLLSKT